LYSDCIQCLQGCQTSTLHQLSQTIDQLQNLYYTVMHIRIFCADTVQPMEKANSKFYTPKEVIQNVTSLAIPGQEKPVTSKLRAKLNTLKLQNQKRNAQLQMLVRYYYVLKYLVNQHIQLKSKQTLDFLSGLINKSACWRTSLNHYFTIKNKIEKLEKNPEENKPILDLLIGGLGIYHLWKYLIIEQNFEELSNSNSAVDKNSNQKTKPEKIANLMQIVKVKKLKKLLEQTKITDPEVEEFCKNIRYNKKQKGNLTSSLNTLISYIEPSLSEKYKITTQKLNPENIENFILKIFSKLKTKSEKTKANQLKFLKKYGLEKVKMDYIKRLLISINGGEEIMIKLKKMGWNFQIQPEEIQTFEKNFKQFKEDFKKRGIEQKQIQQMKQDPTKIMDYLGVHKNYPIYTRQILTKYSDFIKNDFSAFKRLIYFANSEDYHDFLSKVEDYKNNYENVVGGFFDWVIKYYGKDTNLIEIFSKSRSFDCKNSISCFSIEEYKRFTELTKNPE